MSTVIRTHNLGKRYMIGASQRPAVRSVADLVDSLAARIRTGLRHADVEEFWALRGLDLKVEQGDRLGIVGGNGAGKSTLLKLLSRITDPTEGHATLRARVASLLEVGTGFHPELSGRENVFLNGAIMGMSRRAVQSRFDEIVDFSGVERFLDTAVKHYSSGMYMRLAFSVAAHLDSDVLIVDEVLAVGDAEFQEKCLGKIGGLSSEGRTLIFVSHNSSAVRRLCNRAILLSRGRLVADDAVGDVLARYWQGDANGAHEMRWAQGIANPGVNGFRLFRLAVTDPAGQPREEFDPDEAIHVHVEYGLNEGVRGMRLGIVLHTTDGMLVFESYDVESMPGVERPAGRYRSRCVLPAGTLNAGEYVLGFNAGQPGVQSLLYRETVLSMRLAVPDVSRQWALRGVIRPRTEWLADALETDVNAVATPGTGAIADGGAGA